MCSACPIKTFGHRTTSANANRAASAAVVSFESRLAKIPPLVASRVRAPATAKIRHQPTGMKAPTSGTSSIGTDGGPGDFGGAACELVAACCRSVVTRRLTGVDLASAAEGWAFAPGRVRSCSRRTG